MICYADNDFNAKKQALKLISEFADNFCNDVPLKGTANSLEFSGKAKIELNGIIKEIADLGIEGAGKYQKSEYQGLLQKDLIQGYKTSNDCRKYIWKELSDTLLMPLSNTKKGSAINNVEQHSTGNKGSNFNNVEGDITINY